MANEKILQTRIITKHADWETWQSSTLELKEGEIVLAKVTTNEADPISGRIKEVPAFIAKVGNGGTFANTPWMYAKAVDVYGWAKKANLDAADIPALSVESCARILPELPVESPVFALLKAYVYGLVSAEAGAREAADNGLSDRIDAIEESLGTADGGLVARVDAIAEDVETNKTNISTNAENIAKNTTAIADEVSNREAAISAVTGAYESADSALGARIDAINTSITGADGINSKIAANTQAITDEAATRATAIENIVKDGGTIDTKVAAEASARESAVQGAIDTAKGYTDGQISELKGTIDNLTNIMNYRGAVNATTDITDPKAGDVVTLKGDASEWVYDGSAWVEIGTASASDAAIDALADRVDAIEPVIADLPNTYVAQGAYDSKVAELAGGIADNKAAIGDASSGLTKAVADNKAAIEANDAEILALQTTVGDDSNGLVKAVADNAKALNDYRTTVSNTYATKGELEGYQSDVADDFKGVTDRLDAVEGTVGDADSGLVKDVADLKTAVGDANNGLTKAVADNTAAIQANDQDISDINGEIGTIKSNFIQAKEVSTGTFVAMVDNFEIIFDCGGAE